MALKALICTFALFQTITGQALNNIRGLNGNGLASSILAGNSLLNGGVAGGLSSGLASGQASGLANLPSGLNQPIASNLGSCGVASTGGGLPTQSSSPGNPNGISVVSDNAYEGGLCLGGNLPLLGSVALEGTLPTSGQAAVSYGCGNGAVGITNETPISTGITSPGTFPPNIGSNLGGFLNRGPC